MNRYGLSIKLDCENAAFDDDGRAAEVARILRRLANKIEQECQPFMAERAPLDAPLFDLNGNLTGNWSAKVRRIRN